MSRDWTLDFALVRSVFHVAPGSLTLGRFLALSRRSSYAAAAVNGTLTEEAEGTEKAAAKARSVALETRIAEMFPD